MSSETYKKTEDVEDRLEVNLGVPEKQPRDLGIHKVVFTGHGETAEPPMEGCIKPAMEAITIVQDDHCQWDKEIEARNRSVRRRIISSSVICLLFIGMEFGGGLLSNSLVIAADATQLLTVFSTLMVSLFALELSSRRSNKARPITLSWYRFEVMAALFSVLLTWVLSSVVLYLAFDRIVTGDFVLDVDMMLATSAFGVVANLLMGMALHNNCQARGQGGCQGALNTNVRAAFMHIVFDFMFSLGVFVTALFIDCCPDWHIVDPICTFVFSIFVLLITLALLKDILNLLMNAMPRGIYLDEVLKTLLTTEGVQQVDNMKLWVVSLDKIALSAHLTIRPGADHNEVLKNASRKIHAKYNFYEMTLHIEAFQDNTAAEPQTPPPETE
ncbi:zinc transporter 2-like [Homalodisca vitripennis]|uniref:Cation efflux protein cytoplasmic domain-containing protein n=1 Tax=Homalodisca liturata TaxID=320908 RepID=A0A1B6HUL9_9HEMI|nr:zinc transporter 2-like [Homalodisca vitripennis]